MAQPDGQHSPRPGRPEAAAVVWDWRAPDDSPDRAAAARKAGVIRALVAGVAGGADDLAVPGFLQEPPQPRRDGAAGRDDNEVIGINEGIEHLQRLDG